MMASPHSDTTQTPPGFGSFVDEGMTLELVINENNQVVVFHNKPFRKSLSWVEYNLADHRLHFIMNDGDIRDFGIDVPDNLSREMHNAHQITTILLDDETGEPIEGYYHPLIIHQA